MKIALLQYLLGIFRYYFKTCTSSIVMFCIGIVVCVFDATHNYGILLDISIEWYIKAIPFVIAFILFIISIISFYLESYPRKNELNFESIIANWRILNEKGDLSSKIQYKIVNRSNIPIAEIRSEREGFVKKVPKLDIQYSLDGDSKTSSSIKIKLEPKPKAFERDILVLGDVSKVYSYEWGVRLSPGLAPLQKIQIVRNMNTLGTEINSFSKEANWSGWRIIYPTQYLEINLISPDGLKIVVLEHHCLDDTGNLDKSEQVFLPKPMLSNNDTVLIWKIFFPLRERRYRFKYYLTKQAE